MPSGIVSITSTVAVGVIVRYNPFRSVWIIACCVPGILGGGLLSFMPETNQPALLAGIYLVNGIVATLILTYQWLSANVAGSTKRTVGTALVTASFGVGNIIGPQTFQAKDAPDFIPAKIAILATQAAAAGVAALLFVYYAWANRRKERVIQSQSEASNCSAPDRPDWDNLTDKENISFRYVY